MLLYKDKEQLNKKKIAVLEKRIILKDHRSNADPNNRIQTRIVRREMPINSLSQNSVSENGLPKNEVNNDFLDDIKNSFNNEQEYARTFLQLDDLPKDNRFRNLFHSTQNSITSHPNRDVSMTLLTPMYNSYESYSSFLNQDPRNTMYQELVHDKPRLICHTVKELQDKYFEPPEYIKFIDSRV